MTASAPRVVLGVAGGIAAYKAVEVLRGLVESGHAVTVIPTQAALRFVGEPTWAALSGQMVATSLWEHPEQVPHVRLGQQADCLVIAPATADLLARLVTGIAGDLLTNVVLTARCPIVIAPAMHTEMWLHPATVTNVAILRERGAIVLEPAVGRLTGADSGPGRLPDPNLIVDVVQAALRRAHHQPAGDLAGLSVVVTSGGTREGWDPVRYLGNRSSGRQGVALARAAIARGAKVHLVAGAMEVPAPAGAHTTNVESAEQMLQALRQRLADCDVLVMAAAVADFRPAGRQDTKIKKEYGVPELTLEPTVDVLATVCAERDGARPMIVGFAAETATDDAHLLSLGADKLRRKGCELLVVNDVGGAVPVFGTDRNQVTILDEKGIQARIGPADKGVVAHGIWDAVRERLPVHRR
ncbi:MAG: bifunctional phosphopantothenoylcysteine decarboxylase/phosphopantothenate--cysteine ligase CoaBC [Actinomycetales bacterium]